MKPVIVLMLWVLIGLYFGVSGVARLKMEEDLETLKMRQDTLTKKQIDIEVNEISFTDEYSYEYYTTIGPYVSLFPWFFNVPSIIGIFLTAMSFGLIGSIGRLVLQITKDKLTLDKAKIWSEPVLGIFIGIAVLGLSYVVPNLLVADAGTIRPVTLMFLTFFCGLYSQEFFEILSNFFSKFFKS